MNNLLPITIVASLLLGGCGGGGGGGGGGSSSSTSGNASALIGSWVTPCNDSSDGTSSKSEITYSSSEIQALHFDYSDLSCVTKSSTETVIGKYVVGNDVTTSSGVIATEIDFFAESINGESISEDIGYTIFYIDSGKLYLGDHANDAVDGTSPSKRPIDVDFNDYQLRR
ncbi:hypothetical protein [Marinomonas sp. 2405UD68-3]|uniref:hypothetical protein n=1 Tax=Marinomonas sp. 2405UD68-3 TaxID=3391835 RepID=UPI0039C9DA29